MRRRTGAPSLSVKSGGPCPLSRLHSSQTLRPLNRYVADWAFGARLSHSFSLCPISFPHHFRHNTNSTTPPELHFGLTMHWIPAEIALQQ